MRRLLPHLFVILLLGSCTDTPKKIEETQEPVTLYKNLSDQAFVGGQVCQECHQEAYQDWKGSHHDQAMKIASDSTIEGDFNNTRFSIKGVKYKFFKKDGQFMVNTQSGDGSYQDFKIAYTFGVYPLQQYLAEFPNGKYQTLQAAWDSKDNKWMDVQPRFDIVHDEWLHWTRGAMNWNSMCADCHSTNLHKNYDLNTDSYHTTFSEINVSCESCHGPGEEHVKFYSGGYNKNDTPPQLYMTNNMKSTELVDKCARCHSRRGQTSEYFNYEGHFFDHYDPELISDGNYFPDGQILDEDYVWASFRQSKMFHNGVSCKDCHNVHSLELKSTTNQLCLQCHNQSYDNEAHHFHPVDSESGKCINCHMTGRTYMGNDFRRDHSFRVPRPDQSVVYGTPNACTSCHEGKSDEWAAKAVKDFYGDKRPPHFSDLLLPGQRGDKSKLYQLLDSAGAPEIARATAIRYLGGMMDAQDIDRIKKYFRDSSALVRAHTLRHFHMPDDQWYKNELNTLLKDPVRLVRTSAAKNKLSLDPNAEASGMLAFKENLETLNLQADFASGRHALAAYYESKRDLTSAKASYEKALEIDNLYNQARMNLAMIYYQEKNYDEAQKMYEKVISLEPDFAYTYYMLGLLLSETGKTAEAIKSMGLAYQKETQNYRIGYNYALMLHQDKQYPKAIKVVDEATAKFGLFEDITYIKLLSLMESHRNAEALKVCEQLINLNPNQRAYRQIIQQLQSESQGAQ